MWGSVGIRGRRTLIAAPGIAASAASAAFVFRSPRTTARRAFMEDATGGWSFKTPAKVEAFDVINMVPDDVLDPEMKDSFRDLARLAEDMIIKKMSKSKEAQHPLPVNAALLRLWVKQTDHLYHPRAIMQTPTTLSHDFLAEARHFFHFASEAYEAEPNVPKRDIILDQLDDTKRSNVKAPRYMVAYDHLSRSVVVSIRGTASISDVITDLYAEATDFLGDSKVSDSKRLRAHSGMASAAEAMSVPVVNAISEAKKRNGSKFQDYKVVITGHSLGAGTACLLSILLNERYNMSISTYAFAPPPVITTPTYGKVSEGGTSSDWTLDFFKSPSLQKAPLQIHAFVADRDIIPRLAHGELLNCLSALSTVDELPWDPLQRAQILLRGSLSKEEYATFTTAIKERETLVDESVDELFIPGNVILMRPEGAEDADIESRAQAYTNEGDSGQPNGDGETKASQIHTTLEKVRKNFDDALVSKGPKKCIEEKHQRHEAFSVKDPQHLSNGFMYYGDSMVTDHQVTSYRKCFNRIK